MFRLLSIEVVVTLRTRLGEVKESYPDWVEVFPNPSNITHQAIAEHAIDLLKQLQQVDDEDKIKKVCAPLAHNKYRPFRLESLLTEDAHQHMQGALFATTDPLGTALKLSELFIKELPNVEQLLKDFNKRKEAHQKEKERLQKSIKNEDQRLQAIQQLSEPRLELPSRYIPNTAEHFKKFAPTGLKFDPQALQNPPLTSAIAQDLNVPNEVLLLLYLGIGIYSPENKILNPAKMDGVDTRYTETVVQMCSGGFISFLFADRSIVYGTNFPFSNVFIDEAFAKESSLNTLYQLIGRAGRVGKSYMAKVCLIGEELKRRFVDFREENVEAKNLEKAMARVTAAEAVTVYTDSQMQEEEKKEKDKLKAEQEKEPKVAAGSAEVKSNSQKAAQAVASPRQAAEDEWEAKLAREEQEEAEANSNQSGGDAGNWDDSGSDMGNWDD